LFCFEGWGQVFVLVSNWGFNTVRKITQHVWRDGQVLRREGVITVEVVEALWVGKIAFYNITRVAVGRYIVQIKV